MSQEDAFQVGASLKDEDIGILLNLAAPWVSYVPDRHVGSLTALPIPLGREYM